MPPCCNSHSYSSERKRHRGVRVVDRVETDGRRATRGLAVPVRPRVRASAPHTMEAEHPPRLGLRRHLLLGRAALTQRLGGDRDAHDDGGHAQHVREKGDRRRRRSQDAGRPRPRSMARRRMECCFLTKVVLFFNIRIHVHSYACVCIHMHFIVFRMH